MNARIVVGGVGAAAVAIVAAALLLRPGRDGAAAASPRPAPRETKAAAPAPAPPGAPEEKRAEDSRARVGRVFEAALSSDERRTAILALCAAAEDAPELRMVLSDFLQDEGIGRAIRVDVIETLLRLGNDSSASARARAVALDALHYTIDGELLEIVKATAERHAPALSRSALEADYGVRMQALYLLRELGPSYNRDLLDLLAQQARTAVDAKTKASLATCAWAAATGVDASFLLSRVLQEPDPELREQFLSAYGSQKDAASAESLHLAKKVVEGPRLADEQFKSVLDGMVDAYRSGGDKERAGEFLEFLKGLEPSAPEQKDFVMSVYYRLRSIKDPGEWAVRDW